VVLACCQDANQIAQAKELKPANNNQAQNQQPLAGLDRILGQAQSFRMDSLPMIDTRVASNVTNVLNDMALNLRKIVMENQRLSTQVQELLNRVQNSTGFNATNTLGNLQPRVPIAI